MSIEASQHSHAIATEPASSNERRPVPFRGASFDVHVHVREIPLEGLTPVAIYRRLRHSRYGFLLESGKGGRYSYAGVDPRYVWTSRGDRCRVVEIATGREETFTGDPFEILRDLLRGFAGLSHDTLSNDLPPALRPLNDTGLANFAGGAVGYFAYDMARAVERLPELADDDLGLPESFFMICDRFIEIDHEDQIVRLVVLGPSERAEEELIRLESIVRNLPDASDAAGSSAVGSERAIPFEPQANMSEEEFRRRVERAVEYIRAGDIFQVNLSLRFAQEFDRDPLDLYETLRAINPSPYMTFIEAPDFAIAGASPELLVKVDGSAVSTRPIAGTRKRGRNAEEDEAKGRELVENEKERAEHLMLVDLERNDIGRVARYGSVVVDEFMAIERYSHVIHIVSNVRGELAEGKDAFDAIRALFPGGTITGAPKVRSMEIIEELEPTRRSVYTGAIGWLGFNGDAELNIAIRSIVLSDGKAYVQVGAGIVADSVPEFEHKESMRKAEASLRAIRQTLGEQEEEA